MTVSRFLNSWFSALDSFNVGPAWPRNRDKLANITPILLWFMILITSQTMYNYRYKGLQPTYNWGAHVAALLTITSGFGLPH